MHYTKNKQLSGGFCMDSTYSFTDWFINVAISENKNRIYVEANGGFGKTTSLKFLYKTLANNYVNYKIIPLFIDAKLLTTKTIPQLILQDYCGELINDETKYDLVIRQLRNKLYKYLLIVDGLNEVDSSVVYGKIIEFIEDNLQNTENVFVILSSRYPIKKYNDVNRLIDFVRVRFKELDNYKVENIIAKKISNPSNLILSVFSNPMMMSIYMNTKRKEKYQKIKNESQVLDIFFSEQWQISSNFRKKKNREEDYSLFIRFIILIFLPNLCRFGESVFQIEDIEFTLKNTNYKNSCYRFIYKNNQFDEIENLTEKNIDIKKYLRDDLRLATFYNDFFVIHQTFASYFQAKYFDLALEAWLKDTSEAPEFLCLQNYNFIQDDYNDYVKMFVTYHRHYYVNYMRIYKDIMSANKLEIFIRIINSILILSSFPKSDKTELHKYLSFLNEKMKYLSSKINYNHFTEILNIAFSKLYSYSEFKKHNSYVFEHTISDERIEEYYQRMFFNDVINKLADNSISKYFYSSTYLLMTKINPLIQNGWTIISNYLNKESIKFINQLSSSKYDDLLKFLQVKKLSTKESESDTKLYSLPISEQFDFVKSIDEKFEPLYPLFLELIIKLLKTNDSNNAIDMSNLDLSNINLYFINSKFDLENVSLNLKNSKINKNSLNGAGYYAVPCIHSDEIRLLWYNDDYICISYPYRKEIVFIFDNLVSMLVNTTNSYRFALETNRISFYGYNFLYVPKNTKELHCYNFILKIDMLLFQLDDKINIDDIKLISWCNGCNYIQIICNEFEMFYNLKGNIVKQGAVQKKYSGLDPKKLFVHKKSYENMKIIKEVIDNDFIIKLRQLTDCNENDYIVGKIGDLNFNMSQYQFNDAGTSVFIAQQFGNTAKLSEYSVIGEKIRDLDFNGTMINKCFITGNSCSYFGFDNNYYYLNSKNLYSKYDFEENILIGFLPELNILVLTSESKILFYKREEDSFNIIKQISYAEIFKSVGFKEKIISKMLFCKKNALILSVEMQNEDLKTEYKFLNLNSDFSFSVFNSYKFENFYKSFAFFDSFHNNLHIANYQILNKIQEEFFECDNFNFYNVYNYNFYLFENDILIVSSSSLNSTIVMNAKTLKVYNIYQNSVIYNAYTDLIILNNNIDPNVETSILSYFGNIKILKINSFINVLNLQGVYFSKEGFSEKEINTLRRSGATVE